MQVPPPAALAAPAGAPAPPPPKKLGSLPPPPAAPVGKAAAPRIPGGSPDANATTFHGSSVGAWGGQQMMQAEPPAVPAGGIYQQSSPPNVTAAPSPSRPSPESWLNDPTVAPPPTVTAAGRQHFFSQDGDTPAGHRELSQPSFAGAPKLPLQTPGLVSPSNPACPMPVAVPLAAAMPSVAPTSVQTSVAPPRDSTSSSSAGPMATAKAVPSAVPLADPVAAGPSRPGPMGAAVDDANLPPHKCTTDQLRKRALGLGIPDAQTLTRDDLQHKINLVNSFYEKSIDDLKKLATVHDVFFSATDSHQLLVNRLIGKMFGAETQAPSASAAPHVPQQPSHAMASEQREPTIKPWAIPGVVNGGSVGSSKTSSTLPRAAPQGQPIQQSHPAPALTRLAPQPLQPAASGKDHDELERGLAQDRELAQEVRRIRTAGALNYEAVLGLNHRDSTGNAVVTQYRQLMRILHPDKRRPSGESQAGGREACEEALTRVRDAYERLTSPGAGGVRSAASVHAQQMRSATPSNSAQHHAEQAQAYRQHAAAQAAAASRPSGYGAAAHAAAAGSSARPATQTPQPRFVNPNRPPPPPPLPPPPPGQKHNKCCPILPPPVPGFENRIRIVLD